MLKQFIILRLLSSQGKILHPSKALLVRRDLNRYHNFRKISLPRACSFRYYTSQSWDRSQVKIDKSIRQKTFYEILQLPSTATQTEIKAAYYELSMIYHPDKNPSDEANETFAELTKAYEVLSNLNTRREYDKEIGNYYTLRGQSKKKNEKLLKLTEEISIELDARTIQQGQNYKPEERAECVTELRTYVPTLNTIGNLVPRPLGACSLGTCWGQDGLLEINELC